MAEKSLEERQAEMRQRLASETKDSFRGHYCRLIVRKTRQSKSSKRMVPLLSSNET
jgi:hypothetical protein